MSTWNKISLPPEYEIAQSSEGLKKMNLGFLDATLYSSVLVFLAFWPGYLVLGKAFPQEGYPFFTLLPIYIVFGTAILTVVSVVSGVLFLGTLPILGISLASLAHIVSNKRKIALRVDKRRAIESFFCLFLYSITFVHFNLAASVMKWPPPGDLIAHGYLVSLILSKGYTPTNLYPIVDYPLYYPSGFHTFVASTAALTGLLPGEALVLAGAVLIWLIPIMLFSMSYVLTRSYLLSLIPFLASFYIHPSGHLGTWVMGFFYNGPYPNMMGYLFSILTFYVSTSYETSLLRKFLVILLAEACLFFVYPPLFLTVGLINAFPTLVSFKEAIREASKGELLSICSLLAVLGYVSFRNYGPTEAHYAEILGKGGSPGPALGYLPAFLDDMVTSAALVSGCVAAMWLIANGRRLIWISTFQLVSMSLIFISSLFPHPLITVFAPARLGPLTWLFSFVVLVCSVTTVLTQSQALTMRLRIGPRNIDIHLRQDFYRAAILTLLLFMVLLLMYPSMVRANKLEYAGRAAWYSKTEFFSVDFQTSKWISENVKDGGLILNDPSWSGLFLPSYGFQRVIFHYFPHQAEYNEAMQIWLHPKNASLVKTILSKLQIRYVYVPSYPYYLDLWMYGGDSRFKTKPYSPAEYIKIFDSYDFLVKVYQYKDSAVYEVRF
jgi:hypothetical protein